MPARLLLFVFLCFFSWLPMARAAEDTKAAFRFLDQFEVARVLPEPIDVADIQLETTNPNKPFVFGQQKGKWLILNIWATWCPPCIEEMPKLDRLKMMRGSPEFDVLAVSTDFNKSASRISYFLKRWKIKYLKALYDNMGKSLERLKYHAVPTTYVINKDGLAVAMLQGPENWASEDALAFIDTMQANPDFFNDYVKHQDSLQKKP